jgi:phosphatidylglycerol:prolipoprotein diacylglycerol transferase
MSLFGGLAAASALVAAWARVRRLPLLPLLDALAPAAAFAFALGRWGCLVAGCCRGFPLPDGWRLPAIFPAPGLFPAPLLQSAVEVLIGAIVLRAPSGVAGARAGTFLALYGASRFALAFVRTEAVVWGGLTTSQLLSIPTVAAGAALVRAALNRRSGSLGLARPAG